jgi:hypothetical protein
MPKKAKPAVTRAEYLRLRKDHERTLRQFAHQADLLESVRKDCETNLRRCGELQAEIDALRKIISRG